MRSDLLIRTPPPNARCFPEGPDLLVLFTRLQWESDGSIHVPGGLDTWKQIMRQKESSKLSRDWNKRNHSLDTPEQLLETMAAYSRMETDCGPLQIYLLMSELDSVSRSPQKPLSPGTVVLLASPVLATEQLVSDIHRVSPTER